MPEAPMRAIVWSTGWIGSIAIRAVNRRPDFALIGVWIHSPEKVGQDAGPLAGLEPIGLATTNDFEALLALAPDCVIYAAAVPTATAAVPDYVRILEAGINIVTVTSPALVFPPGFDPTWTEELTRAAQAGGAPCTRRASNPDSPQTSSPLCSPRSQTAFFIWSSELFLYDQYPLTFIMMDVTGFGKPLDYEPMPAMPGS